MGITSRANGCSRTKAHRRSGTSRTSLRTTAKIAYLYWQKYEYTQDEKWLADRAYPMLKGCVEFYRNFPNLWKEADGKYHIHHTNSNEPAWGVRDSDEDLSALHGLLPIAIRASEILNIDADLRDKWKEFLVNLAPIPTTDTPDALKSPELRRPACLGEGHEARRQDRRHAAGREHAARMEFRSGDGEHERRRHACRPRTTRSTRNFAAGVRATDPRRRRFRASPSPPPRWDAPIPCDFSCPTQMLHNERPTADGIEIFRNRFALREGPGATECERLGRGAEALHTALLQSAPPTPGDAPLIRVFPAWPKEWDVHFKLLTRGAFLISAAMKDSRITFVEIQSNAGGVCRLVNPWEAAKVSIYRDGKSAETIGGPLLELPTARGEHIVVVPQGSPLPDASNR